MISKPTNRLIAGIVALVSVCMAGCHLGESKDIKTDPNPEALKLEAVPIWVSNVVLPANAVGYVTVDLSCDAGAQGEVITIEPMLAPGSEPGAPRVEDIIDLTNSRLVFTIPQGAKNESTYIKAMDFDASKWPTQTVLLLVRDDKGVNWIYGSALVMPKVKR